MSKLGGPKPSQGPLEKTIDAVGTAGAIGGTYFVGPVFYNLSLAPVQSFSERYYGGEWLNLTGLFWIFASGLIVFTVLRGVIQILTAKLQARGIIGRTNQHYY